MTHPWKNTRGGPQPSGLKRSEGMQALGGLDYTGRGCQMWQLALTTVMQGWLIGSWGSPLAPGKAGT